MENIVIAILAALWVITTMIALKATGDNNYLRDVNEILKRENKQIRNGEDNK